jgi:hypothetical protein
VKNTSIELVHSFYLNNDTFKDITGLDLSFIDLIVNKTIFEFPFKLYTKTLITLSLRSCNLHGVNVAFLYDLVNMKEIDLSDNRINISSSFMEKSNKLEKISLSNIGLTS